MRRWLSLGAVAAGAGLTVLARSRAHKLASLPDPYPEERLREEPKGATVFVERPDGTRIRAVSAGDGDGPTVVLAHGYGMSVLCWNVVWDLLLARGCRVVAFDQRGHDRSTVGADGISIDAMAADYLAVLEAFDAEETIVVGHSMGGLLALTALLDHAGVRDRVGGLVLVSSLAGRILEGSLMNRLRVPLFKSGISDRLMAIESTRLILGATFFGDHPSPAQIRTTLDLFDRQERAHMAAALEALVRPDHYPRLGEIRVPTVVVCGRKDQTTLPWHSERLASSIPGARSVWLDRAGHMLVWEAPETIVDAVASLRASPERRVTSAA